MTFVPLIGLASKKNAGRHRLRSCIAQLVNYREFLLSGIWIAT